MTSVYTELTKEAGKVGGPDALRAFYRQVGRGQGVIIGAAVTGVSVGGTLLYNKWRARGTSVAAEQAPESITGTAVSGDALETRYS
ncbi:hypothetical protein NKH18_18115 [Streptomyces sp. M10(2022)]